MTPPDLVGLAEANVELVRDHEIASDHRYLWQAVINGLVPATRLRGRWYLSRQDLPAIAEVLRAMPSASSGRPRTTVSA